MLAAGRSMIIRVLWAWADSGHACSSNDFEACCHETRKNSRNPNGLGYRQCWTVMLTGVTDLPKNVLALPASVATTAGACATWVAVAATMGRRRAPRPACLGKGSLSRIHGGRPALHHRTARCTAPVQGYGPEPQTADSATACWMWKCGFLSIKDEGHMALISTNWFGHLWQKHRLRVTCKLLWPWPRHWQLLARLHLAAGWLCRHWPGWHWPWRPG